MSLQAQIEKRWYAASPGILIGLAPLAWLFTLLARRRRQHAESTRTRLAVPVVVVGNINIGGTGKTPVLVALVQHLQRQQKRVGVVSRGYGRTRSGLALAHSSSTASDIGDEPLEIFTATNCPLAVAETRREAIDGLLAAHELDVILSDDGLQHYPMYRDVEIAVVGKEQGFGNGWCLPVGPLREPIDRLSECDFVLVNSGVGASRATAAHESLRAIPTGKASEFFIEACAWVNVRSGARRELTEFTETSIVAYAGLGQPKKFFDTLTYLGVEAEFRAKPDHYVYDADAFSDADVDLYLMTAKDAVKCRDIAPDNAWYLHIQARLAPDFLAQFDERLARCQAAK